jgi:hypothetical protein
VIHLDAWVRKDGFLDFLLLLIDLFASSDSAKFGDGKSCCILGAVHLDFFLRAPNLKGVK